MDAYHKGCLLVQSKQGNTEVFQRDVSPEEASVIALPPPPRTIRKNALAQFGSANRSSGNRQCLRTSIYLKFSSLMLLLVLLVSGIPGLVLWVKIRDQLVSNIHSHLLSMSILRKEQLSDYLLSTANDVGLLASRLENVLPPINGSNAATALFEHSLRWAGQMTTDFTYFAVYNRTGNLKFATDESQFASSIATVEQESEKPPLHIGFPIHTASGWKYQLSQALCYNHTLVGVLVTWVNATKLRNIVYHKTWYWEYSEILVGIPTKSDQVHLLLPPHLDPTVTNLPLRGAMALAIEGHSGAMIEKDYRGVKVLVAYTPVDFSNWGLLATTHLHVAYSSVRYLHILIINMVISVVVAGISSSFFLAKIFTAPIIELGTAAAALGQGDMTARVKMGSSLLRHEISDVLETFNCMAQKIANYHSILEQEVSERTHDLVQVNKDLAVEIIERKRIELELQEAKDIAVEANKSKSEFLANISHEIRTPLNAIINFTELCLDTHTTPEQKEHLDYVWFSAHHLLRLITDILDFSKIEAGKLEIENIQFSLVDQLEHAISVLAARALKNDLELCCSIDPDVPDQLIGDPGRLLQIFVNLISNGIKFTEKGEVVVCTIVKTRRSDKIELLFSVKDTGKGIPNGKQPLLFQAFSQVDSSTQRIYGGTGLGLAISSKLASAMGGKMWVESDGMEGHGSNFFFTAIFHIPPSCKLSFTPRIDFLRNTPVLVVDDNDSSLMILTDLLKNWGMMADGVNDVESAKHALQKAMDVGKTYRILLLDMWLKRDDASDLVQYICERPYLLRKAYHSQADIREVNSDTLVSHQETRKAESEVSVSDTSIISKGSNHRETTISSIIMLTSVNHTDAARCRELGIMIHTSKPIKRSLLLHSLQLALGNADDLCVSKGRTSRDVLEIPRKSLHILIAEDNIVNQRVAMMMLQKWGHTTVLAVNGEEAVEKSSKETFDLILMDIEMPVCNGFEATAKIRELEKSSGKRTPIVATTAHAMSGDGDRCLSAGMDSYISKPLNAKKMQELIHCVATESLKES